MNSVQKIISSRWPGEISAEEISEIVQEEDVLGIGKCRLALAEGDSRVYKIAWREQGLLANETEYRLWQSADQDLRKLLCPSLELSEDGALLQQRVQPVSYEALGAEAMAMVQRLAQRGIMDVAVNCGFLDGRLVAYDYSEISVDLHKRIYGDF